MKLYLNFKQETREDASNYTASVDNRRVAECNGVTAMSDAPPLISLSAVGDCCTVGKFTYKLRMARRSGFSKGFGKHEVKPTLLYTRISAAEACAVTAMMGACTPWERKMLVASTPPMRFMTMSIRMTSNWGMELLVLGLSAADADVGDDSSSFM